jgi:hypothetical protein
VRTLAGTGAGFLLAVLWFDLMFDVQVRGQRGRDLPAPVLASIAAYYARVTTAARPMNRLIPLVMVGTIGATIAELVRGDLPAWRAVSALVLTLAAVGTAASRTVRNAVRLGAQADDLAQQSRLARTIRRDHVFCVVAITAALAVQLLPA